MAKLKKIITHRESKNIFVFVTRICGLIAQDIK